ncbi:MAG: fibronectin type III domain-containing protein [Nitrospirota bacterium]
MNYNSSLSLPVAICTAAILILLFSSPAAAAVTRVVATTSDQCPVETPTTICYLSFQEAVAAALSGDAIDILPGTHSAANATLSQSVSISGSETAQTILNGGGSGTILTISGAVSSLSIRNLTFFSANTGIAVQNSSSVDIRNNIFEIGTSSTAISISASPSTRVFNNTFYLNSNGIVSNDVNLNIINNIFNQGAGSTAISSNVSLLTIKNNLFFGGNIGPAVVTVTIDPHDVTVPPPDWRGNISALDPKFVKPDPSDVTLRDFHLLASSPCITAGDTSMGFNSTGDTSGTDIGAYGSQSDRIPYIVSVVSALASASTGTITDTITLSWSPNNAYSTKGYNVHYDKVSGKATGSYNGADAVVSGVTRTSPIDVGTATNVILTGLTTTAATPARPVLSRPEPRNEGLRLSWSAVPGATSYTIYYSLASAPTLTFPPITVANTTSYTLSGLVNGELYTIAITAVAQAPYYLAVTAYDLSSTAGTPGVQDESRYSEELKVYVGIPGISSPSDPVQGLPELLVPYPNLPNTGCFIATAAYGSPEAFAVKVLREFRDTRLLTNAPGKSFVRWYYEYSPTAAHYLNEHPALKPFVRAALGPVVSAALLVTRAPHLALAVAVMLLIALTALLAFRKRSLRTRRPMGNQP